MPVLRQNFLGDLLTALWDRGRGPGAALDRRPIEALCRALLSAQGEVSGTKLAEAVLARYRTLSNGEKLAFFTYLNDALDVDAAQIASRATDYAKDRTPATFEALQLAAEPARQELFRRLNQPPGATADLVAMRVDLLAMIEARPDLRRTDIDFSHLLRSWFNRGFLVMRPIDWRTPANILEKIVAYEAVHEIRDWDDLRRRLHPPDRRCFAFFHPAMAEEPLVFVEVALTPAIPGSIDDLLSDDRAPLAAEGATTAVFYSISNCQSGLVGISFGNLLIKQVAADLAQQLPNLKTFVTLSPLPGMVRWLRSRPASRVGGAVLNDTAAPEQICAVAAHYLMDAKRPDGSPADPVARFHLGNGARIQAVHAHADLSQKGRAQSAGAMVNYLYDLAQTDRNVDAYATQKTIAAARQIQSMAKTGKDALNGDAPDEQPAP